MIRAVLAVLLAAALLSMSLPAADAAARERTASRMDRAVDRVAAAATELLEEDPGPTARLAPRRVVTVDLPAQSLTTTRVERVTVDGAGDESGPARISYRLSGRSPTSYRLAAPIATPDGSVALRAPGERTLVLRLVRGPDGEPTVLVSQRGFGDSSRRGSSPTPGTTVPSDAPRVQIPERGQALS